MKCAAAAYAVFSPVVLVAGWLVSSTSLLFAKEGIPQYHSRLWQVEDGLPHNMVHAVAQTPDGYLWAGTRQGLARFDGLRFVVFQPDNAPELAEAFVTALCTATDGSLWVATEQYGIGQWKEGVFKRYGPADGLLAEGARTLFSSIDGSVWIGTTNGLSRFQDGKIVTYGSKEGLRHIIKSISPDKSGDLWLATSAGVSRMHEGDGVVKARVIGSTAQSTVRVVHSDRAGFLWVGSTDGLLRMRGPASVSFSESDGLADNSVTAIHEDRHGTLWIGTFGGLSRMISGKIVSEAKEGMSFDTVNTIFEDREGNIWIGAKDGLMRLNQKRFLAYTQQHGLSHNNVMSVLEDQEGAMWVGTWGGGLNRMTSNVWTNIGLTEGLTSDLILALHEDAKGDVWIGTDFDHGLFRWSNGAYSRYGKEHGLEGTAIRAIAQDWQNQLWVGTGAGLARFDPAHEKFTMLTPKEGLVGLPVRVIHRHGNDLWIGTAEGLSRYSAGKFVNFTARDGLAGNKIYSIYSDRQGTLWIGTGGSGLSRFLNGEFHAFSTKDGLLHDEIYEILEDQDHLWMSSPRGIFRVSKKNLNDFAARLVPRITCISYGKENGLISIACNGVAKPAAWKSKEGKLWFATTKGLVVTDPAVNPEENPIPPPVIIEEISVDKNPVRWAGNRELGRLAPGRGELEFRYTALSFRKSEKNRFKYKLDGVDSDWVDAGEQRVARYNNILPGSYTFRVKGCNDEGVWNEAGAAVGFSLEPHFWQTWWFGCLVALISIGSLAGTVRFISLRKLHRELERLEQQHALEKERARIAKDIHDDVGASLTQVVLLSELGQKHEGQPGQMQAHFQQIAATSQEMVEKMDQIVWALNPRNDTLENIANYICHFAENFFRLTPVRCRLDIPAVLPPHPLPADARHNIFLSVKEALNNVAKHSAATEVWVKMGLNGAAFRIAVEDNGKGFTPGSGDPFGNGLGNMEKRIQQVGGNCRITSAPGKGTWIYFEIPLRCQS